MEFLIERFNAHNVLTGSATIVLLAITAISFFFAPAVTAGRGLKFVWKAESRFDKPSAVTKDEWLLIESLRESLMPKDFNEKNSPGPSLRLFVGTSSSFMVGTKKLTLRVSAANLQDETPAWSPDIAAFVVRRYKGYSQVFDIRSDTGMPAQIDRRKEIAWTIENAKSGESLIVFLFVVVEKKSFESIKNLNPDQLFKLEIT